MIKLAYKTIVYSYFWRFCQTACPVCGAEMHYTKCLADEMVEEAISQNAEVKHIFAPSAAFEQYGIGAKLRFTL